MIDVAEIVRQARVNILRDVDAGDFEFNDRALLDALNSTIQLALKVRPMLLWVDTHTYRTAETFAISALTDAVDFPASFLEALVMGVCAVVCRGLQADKAMAQAGQQYEARFIELMRI